MSEGGGGRRRFRSSTFRRSLSHGCRRRLSRLAALVRSSLPSVSLTLSLSHSSDSPSPLFSVKSSSSFLSRERREGGECGSPDVVGSCLTRKGRGAACGICACIGEMRLHGCCSVEEQMALSTWSAEQLRFHEQVPWPKNCVPPLIGVSRGITLAQKSEIVWMLKVELGLDLQSASLAHFSIPLLL